MAGQGLTGRVDPSAPAREQGRLGAPLGGRSISLQAGVTWRAWGFQGWLYPATLV